MLNNLFDTSCIAIRRRMFCPPHIMTVFGINKDIKTAVSCKLTAKHHNKTQATPFPTVTVHPIKTQRTKPLSFDSIQNAKQNDKGNITFLNSFRAASVNSLRVGPPEPT